jgi:quinol monooxygenase YgiN
MIMATLRLRPAAGMKYSFVSALQEISALAEAMPGCLESLLYRAADDEDVLLYFERWVSEEDLVRHLKTESYGKLLSMMEQSADWPELNFYQVVKHTGLDTVVEARQPN